MNEQLPPAYQRVKQLLDAGASNDEIAARMGIDPSAVPALIALTNAKSERAVQQSGSTTRR
jgi:DNA-binding NarL/FixJ family response regulator